MTQSLSGKVAVITGTGDGMGRTAALRFAAEGAMVVGCDINVETAAETQRLVTEAGGTMECLYPLDLSDEAEAHRLMEHAVRTFGGIDILYNNAMDHRMGTARDTRLEDWNLTLTHTLTIGWLATKHAVPFMRRRGGGAIIFIASGIGVPVGTGMPGNLTWLFPYSVAKAAVIRMAHAMAIEFAEDGVRVNTISPGPVRTPITEPIYGVEGTEQWQLFEGSTLVGRLGMPDDIVSAAVFLAGDESSWVTGQHISVDGGMVASGCAGRPDPRAEQLLAAGKEWLSVDDQWRFEIEENS